jgi:hypothetical protein
MAKAKAAAKRKKAKKKVWHIFHFGQRYELPDDVRYCRVTALKYTMDFVSADDDEAISFQQQFDLLRSYKDCLAIKGAFRELKTMAANRSRCYRGYLLNEKLQPATTKRISQLLQVDEDMAAHYLEALEDVGLIERIPMPDFDESVNGPPGGDSDKTSGNSTEKPKRTYRRRGSTTKTSVSGRRRKAFNKVEVEKIENGKDKNKTNSENEKEDKNIKESKEQNQQQKEIRSSETKARPDLKARSGAKGAVCDHEGETVPHSTDSTDSTQSDGCHSLPADAAVGSVPLATQSDGGVRSSKGLNGSDGLPLSSNTDAVKRVYDPACKEFAIEVYTLIGTPYAPDSLEAAQNLGCFAARWQEAQQAGIGIELLHQLWTAAMAGAKTLNAKRKRKVKFTSSPEAVWVTNFRRKLAKLKAEHGDEVKVPEAGHG